MPQLVYLVCIERRPPTVFAERDDALAAVRHFVAHRFPKWELEISPDPTGALLYIASASGKTTRFIGELWALQLRHGQHPLEGGGTPQELRQ